MTIEFTAVFPATEKEWNKLHPTEWAEKTFTIMLSEVALFRPKLWGEKKGIEINLLNGSWHFTTYPIRPAPQFSFYELSVLAEKNDFLVELGNYIENLEKKWYCKVFDGIGGSIEVVEKEMPLVVDLCYKAFEIYLKANSSQKENLV